MHEETRNAGPNAYVAAGIAFAAALAAFLHLWLTVRVADMYYAPMPFFPAFMTGKTFLAEYTGHAGGLTEYAAAFLYQLFFIPWAGALVVVAAAAVLSLATGLLARATAGEPPFYLAALPAVMALLLANRYVHFLEGALALTMAAGVAALWVRTAAWRSPGRAAALLGLGASLYYLGAGACACFAALCGLAEALNGRFRWALAAIVTGAVIPLVWAAWLMPVRLSDAYLRLMPVHRLADLGAREFAVGLFLSVPLAVTAAAVAKRLRRAANEAGRAEAADGRRSRLASVVAACLVVGAACAVLLTHDRHLGCILRIERAKRTGSWGEVPELAAAMPRSWLSVFVSWDVNLGLCRSRELLDRMFEFPQSPIRLMATPDAFDPPTLMDVASMQASDLLMEQGLVNDAERMAFQAMELFGRRPWILRRLVETTGVRGELEASAVLLGYLSRYPFHGAWARRQLAALREDPGAWDGGRFDVLRERMPAMDTDSLPSGEEMLIEQLAFNPRNRAAIDYLLAGYMLRGDLASVALRVGQLRDVGYEELPRHVDEAVALYEARGGRGLAPDARASAPARARLEEFAGRLAEVVAVGGDAPAALRESFGASYFYYHAFGPQEAP